MTLSKIIDMAVGVTAIVVVAVLARNLWLSPSDQEFGNAREGVVSTEEAYPALATDRPTVVLIASATCRYCEASLAFYRTLADHSRRGRRFDVAVLVPANNSSDDLKTFFKQGGVADVHWVEGSPPASIRGVPAVMALDAAGRVLASWVGKMSPSQEQALIELFAS